MTIIKHDILRKMLMELRVVNKIEMNLSEQEASRHTHGPWVTVMQHKQISWWAAEVLISQRKENY